MEASKLPAEQFLPLVRQSGVVHCFTLRVPGVDASHDKAEALRRLDEVHRQVVAKRILKAFAKGEGWHFA